MNNNRIRLDFRSRTSLISARITMATRILIAAVFLSHVVAPSDASVFSHYTTSVTLNEDEALIIPIETKADISWCFWEYKSGQDDSFNGFYGFDVEHNNELNISYHHAYFTFLNEISPCLGGIWSPATTDVKNVVGFYRFNVVAKNGTTMPSPEMEVKQEEECVIPPCVIPPCSPPPCTTPAPEPPEDCTCGGLIGMVIFFVLLLLVIIIVMILYWKGKLPKSCTQHIPEPDPEKANANKSRIVKPDQKDKRKHEEEAKKLLSLEEERNDMKEHIEKLEKQQEDMNVKINNLEADLEEKQRQNNKLHSENADIKRKNEAQAEELAELEKEKDSLREQLEMQQQAHQQAIDKLNAKLEAERRPTTMEMVAKVPKIVRNKMNASFRRKDKPNVRIPGSDVRMSDISSVFIIGLKDTNLKKDDELKLEVKLAEDYIPKWFRYGQNIDKMDSVTISKAKKDPSMTKLKIKKKTADMSGVYLCMATKDDMSKTSQSTVKIVDGSQESPIFDEWPDDMYVNAGEEVEFIVSVTGNPLPTPVWLHKGKHVTDKSNISVEITDKNKDRLTSILTFQPCYGRDSGEIKVTATNALGSTSCTAELAVLESSTGPNFVRGLQKQQAQVGENVTFYVIVTANPDPSFDWYNGGKPILESDRVTIKNTHDGRWTSTLRIQNCSIEDGGLISVTARNDVSKTFCDAQFTVTD